MLFFLGQDRSFLSDEPKANGLLRIVCVGDSMTYGQGCLPTETLPFQLEAALNSALWEQQIEVINGGVCGYSIHDAWGRYLSKFARFSPDVIVVTVCDNDAELYNHREATDPRVKNQTYLEFSESCYDPAGEHFPYFQLLVADMARHVAAGGPRVIVAFYDIHGGDHRERIMPHIRDACQDAGVPFSDLSQDFLGGAAANQNSKLRVSEADHHPSVVAHGIASRRLARSILEAGLLPVSDGKLSREEDMVAEHVSRISEAIQSGTNPGKALFFLKRTLAAKRDSRTRLKLKSSDLLSEESYRTVLSGLGRSWARFVTLAIWEAYFEGLKEYLAQFDFGIRLFDVAAWRLLKSMYVLEKRLSDPLLPPVGEFQVPHGAEGVPNKQQDLDSGVLCPEQIDEMAGCLAAWRKKFERAREFAGRSFHVDVDNTAALIPNVEKMLQQRLCAVERQLRPLWSEAECLIDVSEHYMDRLLAMRSIAGKENSIEFLPALTRICGLMKEAVNHLDYCLTAARFDTLLLFAQEWNCDVQKCLTSIQIQVAAGPSKATLANAEPLSLEIQIKPAAPFGRITSDIHTIVRDGSPRVYQFELPFFIDAELRLGFQGDHEVEIGTVRLSNTEHHVITLTTKDFTVENDGAVYTARVLVPP